MIHARCAIVVLGMILLSVSQPAHASGMTACGTAAVELADESASGLQKFVDRILIPGMAEHHVPGAVVSVVRDGQLLFAKGYGWADVATRTPVDAESTLFRIASISKLFTATAVMQMHESGVLALDDDIGHWLPFRLHRVSALPVSLRTLLTHTAGFEEGAFGMSENHLADLLPLAESLRRVMPHQVRPPGDTISYSNHGVALAGYVVQRSSGRPFDDFIERNIFTPLAMTHSTFAEPLPAALAPHLARGYEYSGGEFHERAFQFVSEVGPAASLSTSAGDMAHFMIMQLDAGRYAGNTILQPASVAEMQREQYSASPTHASSVGLSFSRTFRNGTLILSHGGDLRDYVSTLVLLPSERTGLFASFSSASAQRLVNELPSRFIDRYLGTQCVPAPPAHVDMKNYTGAYRLSRAVESNFAKIAYLFIEFPVNVAEGGLSFDGGHFAPVAPGRFVQTATGPSGRTWGTLEFFEHAGRMQIAFSQNPFVVARRLPVQESASFTKLTLLAAVLLLLTLSTRAWWTRLRHRPAADPVRRQRSFAVASLLLIVTFWSGFVGFLLASGILDTGFPAVVPMTLRVLLCLPWIAVLLTLAAAWTTVPLMRLGAGTAFDRSLAVLSVLLLALVLGLMAYWNALSPPWR